MKRINIYILFVLLSIGNMTNLIADNVSDSTELAALKALYTDTNGAGWSNKTNWPTLANWPATATSADFGTWHGITVTNGDIERINLSNNNLSGSIPPAIGNLTELTRLFLHLNSLSGTIPLELGSLTKLFALYLYNNQLTGSIPVEFGNLTSLSYLYLYNNQLSGNIPSEIGDMALLKYVYLYNNQLSGSIPVEIANLTQLVYLYLYDNQLTGSIPNGLGSLRSFINLRLQNNQLTGTIPTDFGTSSLKWLYLHDNQISGEVPPGLASLSLLTICYIHNNELTTLPDFSSGPNKANLYLNVSGNHISHGDIEQNLTGSNQHEFNSFVYSPQTVNPSGLPQQMSVTTGNALEIPAFDQGAHNQYVWEKQAEDLTWVDVSAQNDDPSGASYTKYNPVTEDSGVYRCTVTNTWISGYTFTYPNVTVDVEYIPELVVLDKYAFQYKYDERQRLVEQKIPGAGWKYLVYDNRDRIVLTQDANQRVNNQWLFTKYDHLNRPVSTGIYVNTTDTTRPQVQTLVNSSVGGTRTWFETRQTTSGNVHGYDNLSFPDMGTEADYLTVTYYDNYDWNSDLFFSYGNPSLFHTFNGVDYQSESSEYTAVKGYVTGGKTKNLATGTWLKSMIYYDDRYRVIQSVTDNIIGGKDRTSNLYDFTGKVLKNKSIHDDDDLLTPISTIVRTFDYDHADRLLTVKHRIGTQAEVTLVENEYNEIGELVDKKLHSTNGTDFMQSMDYRYNIRGWLTSMNNSTLTNSGTNDDDGDFFGFELTYNNVISGVSNTATYNGNISAMVWSDFQKTGGVSQRAYSYSYDPMNRLKQALHHTNSTGTFSNVNDYKVSGIDYDLNGNIEALQRLTVDGGGLDDLSYTYENGNQLTKVDDGLAGSATEGFIDGESQDIEYAYDDNGNMIADVNKGIVAIDYNYLNLPEKIDMGNDNWIETDYDASGIKLRKRVFENSVLTKTTEYIGKHIYETEGTDPRVLQFIQHEEGRLIQEPDDSFTYQYHLKDHLGNTRATFTSGVYTNVYTAKMESEVQAVADQEESEFYNIAETRHTYLNANHTVGGNESAMLNSNNPIGPAFYTHVERGDIVNFIAYAYYEATSGWSNPYTPAVLAANIAGVFGTSGGAGEAGQIFSGINDAILNNSAALIGGNSSDTEPSSYINYLMLDDDFNYIPNSGGFVGVTSAANGVHESIANQMALEVEQSGYLYIYTSNESNSLNPVYFDDFDISITEGPVLETTDYYPFGLTFGKGSGAIAPEPAPTVEALVDEDFASSHGFAVVMGSAFITSGKLRVNSNIVGIVERTVPTEAGSTVTLDFYFQKGSGNVRFYIDGILHTTFSSTGQKQITLTGTGSDMVFKFQTEVSFSGTKYFYLDDFLVEETVLPEAGEGISSPYFKPGMVGQNFKYNGMEEVQDLGLGWLFPEEFRTYDPALGRFMQIDPVIKEHESVYAWNTNNPILYPDPLGSDSTERANAVAQAKLFKTKNSGNDYGQRDDNKKIPKAGEKNIDCSGLVRACINKGTGKDPFDGTSHKKADGTWKRGVEILVDSEGITEIEMSELEVGSMVTLNNSSTGKDSKKDLGHAGIISSITRDGNGNITELMMIDSGGRPSTGKSGPRYQTLISGGVKKYYGKRITGAYKWDPTPDVYNGGTMRPITIRSTPLGNGGAVTPRKILTL